MDSEALIHIYVSLNHSDMFINAHNTPHIVNVDCKVRTLQVEFPFNKIASCIFNASCTYNSN